MADTTVYTVPDISCGHCKQAIESEVNAIDGVTAAVVDVDQRTVSVDGTASNAQIVEAIREAGYEPAGV